MRHKCVLFVISSGEPAAAGDRTNPREARTPGQMKSRNRARKFNE